MKCVKIILIILFTLAGLSGIIYGIYWRLTHMCIAWEAVPTGEKCVDWETRHYSCLKTDYEGDTKWSTCSETYCSKYVPCKECVNIVHIDDAPAELEKPNDRCGW